MNWTGVIPLNWGRDCKTRLSVRLTRAERDALVEAMARHVIDTVRLAGGIGEIVLLSPENPGIPQTRWVEDAGNGLNAAIAQALANTPTLIVHGDLPLLEPSDVEAALAAAERSGVAMAPDRAQTGTNTLALVSPQGVIPAFGEGSFARHMKLFPDAAIVRTLGLATDIDTPDDLDFVGHRLPDMTGYRAAPV